MMLKTVIFLGSARSTPAFWGGDARLGDRVTNWVQKTLATRTASLGEETITHDVTIIDPLEVFGEGGALSSISAGELRLPTYFAKPDSLPKEATNLMDTIRNADCILVISPEYNHTVPPALSSLMGHFGGSLYKCKPSGIITYSSGPFAGQRAMIGIQAMLHELGCLPVSKVCGIPSVTDLFEADGTPKDPNHRMLGQLPGLLDQLEWMAVAMKVQREKTGTF